MAWGWVWSLAWELLHSMGTTPPKKAPRTSSFSFLYSHWLIWCLTHRCSINIYKLNHISFLLMSSDEPASCVSPLCSSWLFLHLSSSLPTKFKDHLLCEALIPFAGSDFSHFWTQANTWGLYCTFPCVVVICVCPALRSPSPLESQLTDGNDEVVILSGVPYVLAAQYPPHNRF